MSIISKPIVPPGGKNGNLKDKNKVENKSC